MSQPSHSLVHTPTGFIPITKVRRGTVINSGDGSPVKAKGRTKTYGKYLDLYVSENYTLSASLDQKLRVYRQGEIRTLGVGEIREGDSLCIPARSIWHDGLRDLFSPRYLGLALSETSPVKSSLTVPRIDPIDVIYELEMYPIYVTHDENEKICLFILEEDLEGYHHMDVLRESNLLSGNPESFRLPDRYMDGDSNVRNDILRAFSATPDTDFRAFDYSVDIASTELKQQLHTLATSLGGCVSPEGKQVIGISPVQIGELHSIEGCSYITDGYTLIGTGG